MNDPEAEMARRESMAWRSRVDELLEAIKYELELFAADAICGNCVLGNINAFADELSELDWHGDTLPF